LENWEKVHRDVLQIVYIGRVPDLKGEYAGKQAGYGNINRFSKIFGRIPGWGRGMHILENSGLDNRYTSRLTKNLGEIPFRKNEKSSNGAAGTSDHRVTKNKTGVFFGFFSSMYCIQHCFICRPSDSTVSEATSALAIRRSNYLARSYPHLARSHPQLG
jgi:hypothetical protein